MPVVPSALPVLHFWESLPWCTRARSLHLHRKTPAGGVVPLTQEACPNMPQRAPAFEADWAGLLEVYFGRWGTERSTPLPLLVLTAAERARLSWERVVGVLGDVGLNNLEKWCHLWVITQRYLALLFVADSRINSHHFALCLNPDDTNVHIHLLRIEYLLWNVLLNMSFQFQYVLE